MAKTLSGVTDLVGRHVYPPFKPTCPGKIVRDLGLQSKPNYFGGTVKVRLVRVRFADGQVQDREVLALNDFDALIEDHRKKLATHEANLAKLAAIELETD